MNTIYKYFSSFDKSLQTELLTQIDRILSTASRFGGCAFGDYVANVVAPVMRRRNEAISFKGVDLWFKTPEDLHAFVGEMKLQKISASKFEDGKLVKVTYSHDLELSQCSDLKLNLTLFVSDEVPADISSDAVWYEYHNAAVCQKREDIADGHVKTHVDYFSKLLAAKKEQNEFYHSEVKRLDIAVFQRGKILQLPVTSTDPFVQHHVSSPKELNDALNSILDARAAFAASLTVKAVEDNAVVADVTVATLENSKIPEPVRRNYLSAFMAQ